MKTPATKPKAPAAPAPDFDPKAAEACTPFRHEPTARTAAYRQPGTNGETHLFSATRLYIATEKTTTPAAKPTVS